MNSEFKKILNFKGYGNPKNSTWFIGIEEALEYNKDMVDQSYHKEVVPYSKGEYYREKEKFQRENPGKRYTSVYAIIAKIMSGISGIMLNEYLNGHIFNEKGDCFFTNYYPLGKRSIKTPLPEKYQEWFDIHSESEYQDLVKNHRRKHLYDYWVETKPKRTITFGMGNWDNIRETFKLKDLDFENFDSKMRYYPECNFYLCPFAVNHQMSGKRIEDLVDKIKSVE